MPESQDASHRLRPPTELYIAGWLSIAIGVTVMAGWLLSLPGLTSIVPGEIAMKFNTALVFVIFGVGAVVLGARRPPIPRRWGHSLLALGALAAAVIGLQYALGTDFGIDQLVVVEPAGAIGTVHLGRMSPQTALSFVAIAGAAFCARLPRYAGPATAMTAGVAFLLGSMNLVDFLLAADVPIFLAAYTQMAVPTALALTVLAVGVMGLVPGGGPLGDVWRGEASAVFGRPMLAAALVIPVVVGWLRLEGERRGLYGSAYGVTIMTLSTVLLFVIAVLVATGRLRRADRARIAAETELAHALADANDLYENAPVGYHSLDGNGVFVRINQTELSWLGYRSEDVIGRMKFSDLLTPASVERFTETFPVFRARGAIRDVEFDMIRADGSILPVVLSATAVTDADGNFVMSRSTIDDISDRRRTEEERERAKHEAEMANRAKSEFLSRMSHELRTPLNAVLGFAQVLEMDPLEPEQREHVGYIVRAGRHLLDLINEVLDISRIETGTMTLSLEAVSVNEVAEEVRSLMAPLAAQRNVTLEAESGCGDLHVVADRQRLRQVLLNLLSNAVKYNRPSGLIRMRCSDAAADRVLIEVSDTGHGISAEHLERLFTAFDRLGAERTDVEGTGMGLALSRALVEAMKGTLHAASEVGVGSTFSVELEKAAAPTEALPQLEDNYGIDPAGSPQRTVLYIEDNLANLRLVERIVERIPNVRLISAMQGRLGLDLALESQPDLVLLDLHLPDMNGLDVLRELQRRSTTPPNVVMLTADGTPWRASQLLEEGALAYLTKPLDVPRFLELLEMTLGVRATSGAS